jgi:hypothetical protein
MMPLRLDIGPSTQADKSRPIEQMPPSRFGRHGFGNAVRGKYHASAFGHFVQLLDEDCAHFFQALDDGAVMDNFVAHIDGLLYFSSASSTMRMARSTPAQKPRGAASSSVKSGFKPGIISESLAFPAL